MEHKKHNPYLLLIIMVILHFLAMYLLMYSMIDNINNFFPNLNQFYMAITMTMLMVIMEMFLMKSMYPNKRLNTLLVLISIFLLFLFLFFIRNQTAISDEQFLKSMIPHHAGAILMCKNADITNPDILELCQSILDSQQSEIDLMKYLLD